MEKNYESNIRLYYLYKVLTQPFLLAPVLAIFLLSRGLSLPQVFLLEGLYGFASMALELPTGAFSDLLGRKKTMIIASVFFTISTITYSLSYGFAQFLLSELIFGIGCAFLSGTDSAFLYDTLKKMKREGEYTKIEGRARSYSLAAAIPGTGIAGFIAASSLVYPFYLTILMMASSVLVAMAFAEPIVIKMKRYDVMDHVRQMKRGVSMAFKSRPVTWFLLFTALIGAFSGVSYWFYQPYMQQVGIDIAMFGIVFALMNMVAAVSSMFASKIEKKIGEGMSLLIMASFMIASFALMGVFMTAACVALFFMQQFVRGFGWPVLMGYLNRHIKSGERATILSVTSLFDGLVSSIMLILTSWIVGAFSMQVSLEFSAVVLFACILPLLIFRKHRLG